jgi:hypothetical protein
MAELDRSPRFRDPDALFVRLVRAHRDLSTEQSRRLDAALVLLLAERLADPDLLDRMIETARAAVLQGEAPA